MLKYTISRGLFFLSLSFTTLALLSCGGSSGGSNPPSAPTLNVSIGLKQLQFSWTAVDTADHYILKENPDGASGFTQIGSNITATSHNLDIAVHNHNWQNARYLLEACNDTGCTASTEINTMDGALQAIGYFKASNTSIGVTFGLALTLSGDGKTLAISNSIDNVYIYRKIDGSWVFHTIVMGTNTEIGDGFGESLALNTDGTILAVGAQFEDSDIKGIITTNVTDNNLVNDSGAVYLFKLENNLWTQIAYIKASNSDPEDYFGSSISLASNGLTLAVAAYGEDSDTTGISSDSTSANNSLVFAGAVYVYRLQNNTWNEEAYIKASNTTTNDASGDFFGISLSLNSDGTTLAVGAFKEDSGSTIINGADSDNTSLDSGAVYIFRYSNNLWNQQAYLKASNNDINDRFGSPVSLNSDGNTLAVTALSERSNTITNDSNNDLQLAGAVYIFRFLNNIWSQQAYIKASNPDEFDYFGQSIDLNSDGNVLIAGANFEDSDSTSLNGNESNTLDGQDSGAVYLFNYINQEWLQKAHIKSPNSELDDIFGTTASISNDGNTIAIGAEGEDSNATLINGNQSDNTKADSGAIYLY